MTSGLDPFLLEILVDPEDKLPLYYFEEDNLLYNPRLHRSYSVRDGIPILLIDEAVATGGEEQTRLESKLASAIETGRPSQSK